MGKDVYTNILNDLGKELPKISQSWQSSQDNCHDIFTPERYYEKYIGKLENKMNWHEHNKYNIHINHIFQLIVGFSLEKVLHFSNFTIKTWDSINLDLSSTLNQVA